MMFSGVLGLIAGAALGIARWAFSVVIYTTQGKE